MNQRYPRNNTEARIFLQSMDHRWKIMEQATDKRSGIKLWAAINRDMVSMHKKAVINSLDVSIKLEHAKSNLNFIGIMKISMENNFHIRFINQLEKWMRIRKVPF